MSHLDVKKYELALAKSTEYINTNKVKSIKPNKLCYMYEVLNYEISWNDTIKLEHILSLILYCDFSGYCSSFSASFRKLSRIESMEDVKTRNTAFYHQSKYFREVIEAFGTFGNKQYLHPDCKDIAELGPFYSGLDCVLAVPQFCLRLAAPTSTSKHLEVSLNFSKRSGMIIELNNPEEHYESHY